MQTENTMLCIRHVHIRIAHVLRLPYRPHAHQLLFAGADGKPDE